MNFLYVIFQGSGVYDFGAVIMTACVIVVNMKVNMPDTSLLCITALCVFNIMQNLALVFFVRVC